MALFKYFVEENQEIVNIRIEGHSLLSGVKWYMALRSKRGDSNKVFEKFSNDSSVP